MLSRQSRHRRMRKRKDNEVLYLISGRLVPSLLSLFCRNGTLTAFQLALYASIIGFGEGYS